MPLTVWRFVAFRIGALVSVLAVALVSFGVLNAQLSAADAGRSTGTRQTLIRYLLVTKVSPSAHTFTVQATTATKKFRNVHVIAYTTTTAFYGSPASDVKVGTELTALGVRSRARLTATKIRVNPASNTTTSTSTTSTTPTGVGGPFDGLKYVGNV